LPHHVETVVQRKSLAHGVQLLVNEVCPLEYLLTSTQPARQFVFVESRLFYLTRFHLPYLHVMDVVLVVGI
jgi:hypothetical protein